jgi:hypothetical protein
MALTNVWLRTWGDGLVRGDQVVGIDVHQTPALTGNTGHWLLDVVLPASTGNGSRGDWDLTALHRTVVQTSQPPGDAATMLARLLAQLDASDAAGVITARHDRVPERAPAGHVDGDPAGCPVRFRFLPFPDSAPGQDAVAE